MSEFNPYLTTTIMSFFVSSVVVLINNFILYRHKCVSSSAIATNQNLSINHNQSVQLESLQSEAQQLTVNVQTIDSDLKTIILNTKKPKSTSRNNITITA
jgi:hypothetical protein